MNGDSADTDREAGKTGQLRQGPRAWPMTAAWAATDCRSPGRFAWDRSICCRAPTLIDARPMAPATQNAKATSQATEKLPGTP